ncbi:hypothetical protein BVC80_1105g7 [Macleaya cordata]|uniref:Uncharacterized protein n=1 Tax=Macleaya cordata TaxID=56857 RepID=A0A200QBK8_MACCD|nr:hypothetical protein BVC80_1105g7 [Macleaya cordata]
MRVISSTYCHETLTLKSASYSSATKAVRYGIGMIRSSSSCKEDLKGQTVAVSCGLGCIWKSSGKARSYPRCLSSCN